MQVQIAHQSEKHLVTTTHLREVTTRRFPMAQHPRALIDTLKKQFVQSVKNRY